MNQIRQGEIWLRMVDGVPPDYAAGEWAERALLAHGETGNSHTIVQSDVRWLYAAVDDINLLQRDGVRAASRPAFVEVAREAVIEHSEREGHQSAVLEPGIYQVTIKREQLPWEAEARAVAD